MGRFFGRVLRSGEHIVPEAALEALADQNIPFTVLGKAKYEQQTATVQGLPSDKLRDTSSKLLAKNRKLYEELKHIGD